MSEVKRYDMCGFEGGLVECKDGAWYHMDDFDRVTADRDAALDREAALNQRLDALQALLNAADERADVLLEVARSLTIQAHASIGNTENHEDCIRDLAALKPADAAKKLTLP